MISQWKFVFDLLKEFNCNHLTPFSSPLDTNVNLRSHEGTTVDHPTYYQKQVGKVNFLTNTTLDLVYGVPLLGQFIQVPREPHMHATFHML